MKVICDNCKREFETSRDMLKERYLGAMITEIYYICPKCEKKYLVCLQNIKTRELKRRIDKLKEAIRYKQYNNYKVIPEVIEVDKLVKELKKEMDKLNGKL